MDSEHLLRMVSSQGLPLPQPVSTSQGSAAAPGLVSLNQMSISMDTSHMYGWSSLWTPGRAQVGLIRAQKIPELGEQWPVIEGRGGYVEACFSPTHTHSPHQPMWAGLVHYSYTPKSPPGLWTLPGKLTSDPGST